MVLSLTQFRIKKVSSYFAPAVIF